MTQKEKLAQATLMARSIKSIARSLKFDANDYDVKFPLEYADRLNTIADKFLKLK